MRAKGRRDSSFCCIGLYSTATAAGRISPQGDSVCGAVPSCVGSVCVSFVGTAALSAGGIAALAGRAVFSTGCPAVCAGWFSFGNAPRRSSERIPTAASYKKNSSKISAVRAFSASCILLGRCIAYNICFLSGKWYFSSTSAGSSVSMPRAYASRA